MGVVADVTHKMFASPEHRRLQTIHFDGVEEGVGAMRQIMQAGLRPFLIRFYDADEARHAMRDSGFAGCVMFLGVEGVRAVAEAEFDVAMSICVAQRGQALGSAAAEAWMGRRFDFSTVENSWRGRAGLRKRSRWRTSGTRSSGLIGR